MPYGVKPLNDSLRPTKVNSSSMKIKQLCVIYLILQTV